MSLWSSSAIPMVIVSPAAVLLQTPMVNIQTACPCCSTTNTCGSRSKMRDQAEHAYLLTYSLTYLHVLLLVLYLDYQRLLCIFILIEVQR